MRQNCGHDADWHASDDAMSLLSAAEAAELVGLYSRCGHEGSFTGSISIETVLLNGGSGGVFFS